MEWQGKSNDVIVSVDWFALSCCLARPYAGQELVVPAGWSVLPCSGTAVWQFRWFIMDELGNKVATILTRPKSPIIDARRAVVEIANPVLYSARFRWVVDRVCETLPMSIEGMNRVDLCGDFEMSMDRWQVVRGLEDGIMYLKGLRRGVVWWSADNGVRYPHQISWGGRDSVFHWKVYYKYKELHEAGVESEKPYIEAMWREFGLEPKNVWRLEVSITSCGSIEKSDGSGKFMPFEWYEKRSEIYERIYRQRFVVRHFEGHSNKRYDPVVKFLMGVDNAAKFVSRKKVDNEDMESSVERRVVCKMWKEYCDGEVRANAFLHASIGEFLRTMCQFERNINAICRRFNVSRGDVFAELSLAEEKQYHSTLNINDLITEAALSKQQEWA